MTEEQEQRARKYLDLIQKLFACPNGQEPEVLDAHMELIDAGLVSMMMQVATSMAHQDNPDGAKFMIFIARELSKQLGLYPQMFDQEAEAEAPAQ
ncbi:MAG: hypothetical protein F6K35_35020 [Okeania sp. SIO2H7]|nr:hypothetical protein [Okeania sp. SIO2H7]